MHAAVLGAVFAVFALSNAVQAQVAADDSAKRARCLAATDTFRTSSAADRGRRLANSLQVCPEDTRIVAYRKLIRENRRLEKDDAMVVIYQVIWHRDPGVLAGVLALAEDRAASPAMRVVAFMALSALAHPERSPRYDGFAGGLDARGHPKVMCALRSSHAVGGSAPLPAGYLEEAHRVASRVYEDTREPEEVRSAAACM